MLVERYFFERTAFEAKYAKEEKRRDVNWFLGSAWEPIEARLCLALRSSKLEAEPPDICYQAERSNE
jgi:hypothetical protein